MNINVLAIYDSLEEQFKNSIPTPSGSYDLITPRNRILPFQIVVDGVIESYKVEVISVTNNVVDITEFMNSTGIEKHKFTEYSVFVYAGNMPSPTPLSIGDGRYYLKITINNRVFYSDIFYITNNYKKCTKFVWSSDRDQLYNGGRIVYENSNFKHVAYINAKIARPKYLFEEESKSRGGVSFFESQISKKTYAIKFVAPEYLCDAMRYIRLADNVIVTDYLNREYVCVETDFNVKWLAEASLATIEIEFTTNNLLIKNGAIAKNRSRRDFNIDFNNDFK